MKSALKTIVTRRRYLRLMALAAGGAAIAASFGGSAKDGIRYRIEPVDGYAYRASFMRAIRGREFESVKQAVRFAKHPSVPFKVVAI